MIESNFKEITAPGRDGALCAIPSSRCDLCAAGGGVEA